MATCLLLAGCAGGPIGPLPPVSDPSNAADVTFYRTGTMVGFPGRIKLEIDGHDIYRLGLNESFSFRLDPGEYIVDFSIGFNECRGAILVYPRHTYRYRLVPNCFLEREMLDFPAYGTPGYAEPGDRGSSTTGDEGLSSTSYGQLLGL